jgi:hypothetical protein
MGFKIQKKKKKKSFDWLHTLKIFNSYLKYYSFLSNFIGIIGFQRAGFGVAICVFTVFCLQGGGGIMTLGLRLKKPKGFR